jgi:hypothetical protein
MSKEAALTWQPWQMAIQRQRSTTNRGSDLSSLASTIRNDRNSNTGLSSKSISRLKEDFDYYSNEG